MSNRRMFWQIVDKIEAAIDQGEYRVGSRLPPERELAENFNVSRPTIREAIIALEVRGKVEVKTGSGVYVLDSANKINTSEQINAFEVTQARALIEGEVAALAAATITDEELAQLEQTLIDMEQGQSIEKADHQFHQIIAKSTRNSAILLAVENLWLLRSSSPSVVTDYQSVCSKDDEKTIAEHRAIVQALSARDATAARNAMHNHFNRLINALFDAAEAKALEEIRRKASEKRDLYSIANLSRIAH